MVNGLVFMYRDKANEQIQRDLDAYEVWGNSNPDRMVKRRREIQYLAGGGSVGNNRAKGPPERSEIKSFSPFSARNLRRYIDNACVNFVGMVTLTYGDEWPRDGRVVKSHLKAWFERLRRTGYLNKDHAVWWLEFQSRGAPHIHMVISGWISRRWVASSWSSITGGNESACSRVESLRDADGVGAYAAKYASKSDQKEVPDDYVGVGRFWGRRGPAVEGGFCPKLVAADVSVLVRHTLRERARAYAWARDHLPVSQRPRGVRVIEHEGGWSIYGNEKEITGLWKELEQLNVSITHAEQPLVGLRRRM